MTPRRVLLLSGSLGAGHHAAADALAERAAELWPGVDVVRADTLEGMGPAAGGFGVVYAGSIRHLPGMYALYFALLTRVGFFRGGTRAVIGAWSGHGIARLLAEHRPDLVLATFPEGITGLGRLRRRGRLPVPAVAVVCDPAPHPMWVDGALDLHLVTSPTAAARVRAMAPGAEVRVGAQPVVRAFRPPETLPGPARPRAFVSCGSLSFGDVPGLCAAVLDGGADVLVSAGRLPSLRRRLDHLAATHPRGLGLEVRDWVDDPAAVTRACDLVVCTGAGATAREALACDRPLLVADPIPGHGRANAEVLAAEGLAHIADGPDALRDAVADLADPARRAALVRTLRARRLEHDLGADLAAVAALPAPGPPPLPAAQVGRSTGTSARAAVAAASRVRAEDALFLYAATPRVPQQVGARIVVREPRAGAPVDWPAHLTALVADRAGGIALLARRLARPRPGRAVRWVTSVPDPATQVHPVVLGGDADVAATAFFAAPLDPTRRGWELAVHREQPGEVTILAKVHHALGDGLAVTDALVRLLTDESAALPVGGRARPDPRGARHRRAARAARAVTGIAALAAAGPAGSSALTGRRSGVHHPRLATTWDAATVRAAARAHCVSTTVLVLGLLAEALADLVDHDPAGVRAMVPLTTRLRRGDDVAAPGNRTAAVSVRLPTAPMPLDERIARVGAALERGRYRHQPDGAAAVLSVVGLLPGALQRIFTRVTYGRRFFHVLASVMPGVRRPLHCHGGLITTVVPVLPLAEGVGLAVGALSWGRTVGVGLTVDPELVHGADGLPGRLDAALARVDRGEPTSRQGQDAMPGGGPG